MHPDPNEAPTSMNVRTRADLDLRDRDRFESRLMNRCTELPCAEGEWPVIEELSAKLGLNIPRVRPKDI
jgi:hypothetical protein